VVTVYVVSCFVCFLLFASENSQVFPIEIFKHFCPVVLLPVQKSHFVTRLTKQQVLVEDLNVDSFLSEINNIGPCYLEYLSAF